MTTKRRKKIKPAIKRMIVERAGGKCANPGCMNWRTHIHHIKHWSVYENDDESVLIAVCPSCHDAIHHGSIEISDGTVFAWKDIDRTTPSRLAHITIEPSHEIKLLTGSIALATKNDGLCAFKLSNDSDLRFRVVDDDLLILGMVITDSSGERVVRVVDKYVRTERDAVEFSHVPGHVKVTAPLTDEFVAPWVVQKLAQELPDFVGQSQITMLELEVLRPGLVKVQGLWADASSAVYISEDKLMFLSTSRPRALAMAGDGENSVLMYAGEVTRELFGFGT